MIDILFLITTGAYTNYTKILEEDWAPNPKFERTAVKVQIINTYLIYNNSPIVIPLQINQYISKGGDLVLRYTNQLIFCIMAWVIHKSNFFYLVNKMRTDILFKQLNSSSNVLLIYRYIYIYI